jgi:hypothetical protein
MSSPVPDINMSSSSVEAKIIAATAANDIVVEDGQLSDDQDSHDRERLLYREKQEREAKRLAVRDLLSENGFAMRKELKNESIKGYFPSIGNGRNVSGRHHGKNSCRRPTLRRQR